MLAPTEKGAYMTGLRHYNMGNNLQILRGVGQLLHWYEWAAGLFSRNDHRDAAGNVVPRPQEVAHFPGEGVARGLADVRYPDPGRVCLCTCTAADWCRKTAAARSSVYLFNEYWYTPSMSLSTSIKEAVRPLSTG